MNILKKLVESDKQANHFGFKWSHYSELFEQIASECLEIQKELEDPNPTRLQEEIGDLIHATISLCLFCGFDPEQTLQASLQKFTQRFEQVKRLALEAGYTSLNDQPMSVLTHFWKQAKELKE